MVCIWVAYNPLPSTVQNYYRVHPAALNLRCDLTNLTLLYLILLYSLALINLIIHHTISTVKFPEEGSHLLGSLENLEYL